MTYIDYMNQFWQVASQHQMMTSEVALYAFLINECNVNFWKMPFECSNVTACQCLRMSKQTLVTARDKLRDVGLISYSSGNSRFNPSKYALLDLTSQLPPTYIGAELSRNYSKTSLSTARMSDDFASLDVFATTLKGDSAWQESVVQFFRKEKEDFDQAMLSEYLDDFIRFLSASGETTKSITDGKKHFVNWLARKQSKKERRNSSKMPVGMILKESNLDKYNSMEGWE